MTKLKNPSGFKKRFRVKKSSANTQKGSNISYWKGKNHFKRNHSANLKQDQGRKVNLLPSQYKLFKKQIPLVYLK